MPLANVLEMIVAKFLLFDGPEKQAKRTAKATLIRVMTGSASFAFFENLVFWECKPVFWECKPAPTQECKAVFLQCKPTVFC